MRLRRSAPCVVRDAERPEAAFPHRAWQREERRTTGKFDNKKSRRDSFSRSYALRSALYTSFQVLDLLRKENQIMQAIEFETDIDGEFITIPPVKRLTAKHVKVILLYHEEEGGQKPNLPQIFYTPIKKNSI